MAGSNVGSALDDYRAHAALGSGAGTFERWWLADRDVALKVRDAHSLYLETLAELGPFGLAALLAVSSHTARRRGSCAPQPVRRSGACRLRRAGRPRSGGLGLGGAGCDDRGAYVRRSPSAGDGEGRSRLELGLDAGGADRVHRRPCRVLVRHPDEQSLPGTGVRCARSQRDRSRRTGCPPCRAMGAVVDRRPQYQADAALADGPFADARRLYRQAIAKDGEDWELWLDLALASKGDARRRALDRAAALNPLAKAIRAASKRLNVRNRSLPVDLTRHLKRSAGRKP